MKKISGLLAVLAGTAFVFVFAENDLYGKPPETLTGKDGAPMVLVPAGSFTMGSEAGGDDEKPLHSIFLDAFHMDRHEVTTMQYARFLEATGRKPPDKWDGIRLPQVGDRPVVGVDWYDADAYCRLYGKRLPTEAEWEKADRGTDTRPYPWGEERPTAALALYDKSCIFCNVYEDVLKPVGSYENGKSPYGIYDMAGSVQEWTADWYDEHYYKRSPERNPTGPSQGREKVVRGGSWLSRPMLLRTGLRNWENPTDRLDYVGFRCALDTPK